MKKFNLNIASKNFIYNLILTFLISLIIFSYMAFYMPNVYLEKRLENLENQALSIHEKFVDTKSYSDISSLSKDGIYSVYIPKSKEQILFSSSRVNTLITAKNKNLKEFISYIQSIDYNNLNLENFNKKSDSLFKNLGNEFSKIAKIEYAKPIKSDSKDKATYKIRKNNFIIKFESSMNDTTATNIVVSSRNDSGVYFTVYPYLIENISNIKSTIISAFPVIFLFIVIIVFLLNKIYSKTITEPIIKMSKFTTLSRDNIDIPYNIDINTNDELEQLSNNIKELYDSLTKNYAKLKKSSARKEIFIKSTSHELKTPLQTAILLSESMINKVGKYSDTEKYLPDLREKLYDIQILIDDLLYMNKIEEEPIFEDLDLSEILLESINNHSKLIQNKNLNIEISGTKIANINYDHFRIIFDNIIKNAIEYTQKNGTINCKFGVCIKISNTPTFVDNSILKKIDEPFISSNTKKSKGMGMYIIKNLLDDMGYSMNINYENNTFEIILKESNKIINIL